MNLMKQIKKAEKIDIPIYLKTNAKERSTLRPEVKAYMKAYYQRKKNEVGK